MAAKSSAIPSGPTLDSPARWRLWSQPAPGVMAAAPRPAGGAVHAGRPCALRRTDLGSDLATQLPWSRRSILVDEHGAPVTFEPARWLVCFVPGLRPQFWHRFVHETHKHVLMLKPNADGTWTLFEPWWTRLLVRTISGEEALRFLHWAALGDVLLVEEEVPGRGTQFRGWCNCASLATFVLGRPYWVWSPHALFKRLRAEARTRAIDIAALAQRAIPAMGSAGDLRQQRRGAGELGA